MVLCSAYAKKLPTRLAHVPLKLYVRALLALHELYSCATIQPRRCGSENANGVLLCRYLKGLAVCEAGRGCPFM